ncbi:hypothetical protein DYB32_001826 [Aphanomyces invadans]|uniref:Fido domain-containing protein n=1 Tax=Aphanomyces invadans TaxID=157072 RepID=A0A3R6W462_9STRA|nr:hypothetical protein DYB32_001826 [Aphanomyces invadans]
MHRYTFAIVLKNTYQVKDMLRERFPGKQMKATRHRLADQVAAMHLKCLRRLVQAGLGVILLDNDNSIPHENQKYNQTNNICVLIDPYKDSDLLLQEFKREKDELAIKRGQANARLGMETVESVKNICFSPALELQLTHNIIHNAFRDYDKDDWSIEHQQELTCWDVVDVCFPLHDRVFNNSFFAEYRKKTFEFRVSKATAGNSERWAIEELRLHFGERVAFLFAFMHIYSKMLGPLMVVCVLYYLGFRRFVSGYVWNYYLLGLAVLGFGVVSLWAPAMLLVWERETRTLTEKWNLVNYKDTVFERNDENPKFEYVWVKNEITHEMEKQIKKSKKRIIRVTMLFFVALSSIIQCIVLMPFLQVSWITLSEKRHFVFVWSNWFFWFLALAFLYLPYGDKVNDVYAYLKLDWAIAYQWNPTLLTLDTLFVTPLVVTQLLNMVLETWLPYVIRIIKGKPMSCRNWTSSWFSSLDCNKQRKARKRKHRMETNMAAHKLADEVSRTTRFFVPVLGYSDDSNEYTAYQVSIGEWATVLHYANVMAITIVSILLVMYLVLQLDKTPAAISNPSYLRLKQIRELTSQRTANSTVFNYISELRCVYDKYDLDHTDHLHEHALVRFLAEWMSKEPAELEKRSGLIFRYMDKNKVGKVPFSTCCLMLQHAHHDRFFSALLGIYDHLDDFRNQEIRLNDDPMKIRRVLRAQSMESQIAAGDTDALKRAWLDGLSLNVVDSLGRTALHVAVEKEQMNAIELLLSAGAAVDVVDHEGRTPMSIAVEMNASNALSLFRRHIFTAPPLQTEALATSDIPLAFAAIQHNNLPRLEQLVPHLVHPDVQDYDARFLRDHQATEHGLGIDADNLAKASNPHGLEAGILNKAFEHVLRCQPEWIASLHTTSQSKFFFVPHARKAGLKAVVAVPMVHNLSVATIDLLGALVALLRRGFFDDALNSTVLELSETHVSTAITTKLPRTLLGEFDRFIGKAKLANLRSQDSFRTTKWTMTDLYDTVGNAHDKRTLFRSVLTALNTILDDTTCVITFDQVKALHDAIFEHGDGGGAIREDAAVGYASERIYRVFLPAVEIEPALREYVATLNDEAALPHPLLRAYYAFSALVFYIHPFYDGNGR